ncbi:MAG: hypothetical protein K9L68_10275 [Spirochaetales bacterium]|nr:hypothetical protein [Spirochaetales bacterium]MCF7938970.1 hypothetical protein [Spirochaetales bacterium]
MERLNNYLYKAVKGDEDSITELLVNLMRRKYLRHLVLNSLKIAPEIINKIMYSDIKTQINEHDVGRPDIIIENDLVKIFIEVKTRLNTDFQDSQLSTYPENLAKTNKYKKLIFLVPKEHKQSEDITHIANKYNNNKKIVEILYWDSLLSDLKDSEIAEDNSLVKEIISFISEKTLNRKFAYDFSAMEVAIMYNYKDLKYSANLLFQFRDYISSLANRIDDKLYEALGEKYVKLNRNIKEKDIQQNSYGVGLYLDNDNIYVGFSFFDEKEVEEWKEAEDYIFSVAFYPSKFHFDGSQKDVYQNEECAYVKLDKYILAENDDEKFITTVVKTIVRYYENV